MKVAQYSVLVSSLQVTNKHTQCSGCHVTAAPLAVSLLFAQCTSFRDLAVMGEKNILGSRIS